MWFNNIQLTHLEQRHSVRYAQSWPGMYQLQWQDLEPAQYPGRFTDNGTGIGQLLNQAGGLFKFLCLQRMPNGPIHQPSSFVPFACTAV